LQARAARFAAEEMNATGVEYVRGVPAVKIFGMAADTLLTFKQAVAQYRSLRVTDIFKTPYSLFYILVSPRLPGLC